MKKGGKEKKQGLNLDDKIKFLGEKIIENGLNLHATDVHIEPRDNKAIVRFRINGLLRTIEDLPIKDLPKLAKYFKYLSGLDFSEKIFSQTETFKYGKAKIRVSILPTVSGEKITLRLIRARKSVRKLSEIGMSGENLERVKQALRQPRGIIITVGDGKNTTNFSLLNELNSSQKSIITVEKNIEKQIKGINQTKIYPKIGLGYYESLKAALNQNPDVILIDNIPDSKTAKLAFDASMNGKLIIASLPVHKLSEAIPFFEYLGIESFLISTNILAIIGQTLIRTAKNAIEFIKLSPEESKLMLEEFRIQPKKLHELEIESKKNLKRKKIYTTDKNILAVATAKIEGDLAYSGTTGIFEVVSLLGDGFGARFKNFVASRPNTAEIESFLKANDFTDLRVDGLVKSLSGETSIKEVARRTGF